MKGHKGHRKTIIAFAAYRLNPDGGQSWRSGKHRMKAANPLDIGIVTARVDDPPAVHHIIGDNQTAPASA